MDVNSEGLAVARRYARWYIGDPGWADRIISAYLNPAMASELLAEEMDD